MNTILISGLVNTETTVRVRQFPIEYYPIDYPFFGVDTAVSGVAWNVARALGTLGDEVRFLSMTGADFPADFIRRELELAGVETRHIRKVLRQTPSSVVLYDGEGRRQIYCDLKDIQEARYGFGPELLDGADIVAACNINFNRPLLALAKAAGKKIATDVHVLSDLHDGYNRDFLEAADILFLSDEGLGEDWQGFLWALAHTYSPEVIVLGRGSKGAGLYLRSENRIFTVPAVRVGEVVNTVGAGDALFSGFLHYYAKGEHPVEALVRSELFASAKIGTSGAARGFVGEEDIDRLYAIYADEIKWNIR